MSTLDSRTKLAKICNVTVKESTLPELKGCLLCGSGFHLIWDPYKMDVLLHSGINLQVNGTEVVANGEVFAFEDYDHAHYCLCDCGSGFAICTSALK
ncbi:hypothetical protein SPHG1_11 [Salmonella phage SPHG1]|nr:hypothetical protein SPHG1_11 [Salmonella phage SPHG1]